MASQFEDLDLYATLGISEKATEQEIKKCYKLLCLKHHPDKVIHLPENKREESREIFEKVQFAYLVLSDTTRRKKYDLTGSVEIGDVSDGVFDWEDYFRGMTRRVTRELIEEDKLSYQGSELEKEDILKEFVSLKGDFLKLFEAIPHLEFVDEEENRVYEIISENYPENDKQFKKWSYYKKNRSSEINKLKKKLLKEAKEAEKLEKEMKMSKKDKKGVSGNENDLRALILGKQKNRMDDLINSLESKYGGAGSSKKAKKRKLDDFDDISEEEFNKTRSKLENRSGRKTSRVKK